VNGATNLAATSSWDGTTRLWDLRSGQLLVVEEGYGTNFSRDGRWLEWGFPGDTAGRWEVFPSREWRALVGSEGETGGLDFSPDGRLLVSSHKEGFRMTEVATGEEIARVPQTRPVRFHPSGRSLLVCGPRMVLWPLEQGRAGPPRLGDAKPLLKGPHPEVTDF